MCVGRAQRGAGRRTGCSGQGGGGGTSVDPPEGPRRTQATHGFSPPQSRPVEFLAEFLRRRSQARGARDGGGLAAGEGVGPGPGPAQASLEWRGVAAGELHRSEKAYLQRLGAVLKVTPSAHLCSRCEP